MDLPEEMGNGFENLGAKHENIVSKSKAYTYKDYE